MAGNLQLKHAKDLQQEPPRSPRQRLGGYAILARTIDKCRAELTGQIGDYHYDCPLDQTLFEFKGINGQEFKRVVKDGLNDEEIIQWLNDHGLSRSTEEIQGWSDEIERASLVKDSERREYFISECRRLGLDPEKATLFDWLEADDRASYESRTSH